MDIIEYLTPKYVPRYGRIQLPEEAPATVLRPSYRRSKPTVSHTFQGLFKNTPFAEPSSELRGWRKRDKEFKRELYKERMRQVV